MGLLILFPSAAAPTSSNTSRDVRVSGGTHSNTTRDIRISGGTHANTTRGVRVLGGRPAIFTGYRDNFNDNSLNPELDWQASGSASVDEVNGRLEFLIPAGASESAYAFTTSGWSLKDSEIRVRFAVPATNQIEQRFGFTTVGDYVQTVWRPELSEVHTYYDSGSGLESHPVSEAPNWVRIRDTGVAFEWSISQDGEDWTVLRTEAHATPILEEWHYGNVEFLAIQGVLGGIAGTAAFDDLNAIATSSTRDTRTTGQVTLDVQHEARVTGTVVADSVYAARTTGEDTLSHVQDIRTTGQLDLAVSIDARISGAGLLVYEQPIQIVGQDDINVERTARVTGESISEVTTEVRVVGTLGSDATIEARLIGESTTNIERDTRVTGQLVSEISHEVRVDALVGLATEREVRIAGQADEALDVAVRVTGERDGYVEREVRLVALEQQYLSLTVRVVGAPSGAVNALEVVVVEGDVQVTTRIRITPQVYLLDDDLALCVTPNHYVKI